MGEKNVLQTVENLQSNISTTNINPQKIGQQIMAVRMIKAENKKVYNGGESFLKVADLAEAMQVSKDEVIELITYCGALDGRTILNNVAMQISECDENLLLSYRKCLDASAQTFIYSKVNKKDLKTLTNFMKIVCISNFGMDVELNPIINRLHKGIDICGRICVETIEEMRNAGYDWTVIAEMFDEKNIFKEWLQWEDAEVKFKEISETLKGNI